MKHIFKIIFLLALIYKSAIAQYNRIPASPCHIFSSSCQNKQQSYLVSNDNRIYLHENYKCTPSSSDGFDVTYSDNDNISCLLHYSYYSNSSYTGGITNAILTDTNIIVQFSTVNGALIYRISSQHAVTQSMTIPNFNGNLSATNKMIYSLYKDYNKNLLFLKKNVNNISFNDTLNYNNIKALPLPKLYFANDSVGYIYGNDTLNNNILLRSTNYGDNWNLVFNPVNAIADIKFNGDTGIAVGYQGTIYKTIDNGLNWISISSGTTKNLNSISIGLNEMYTAGDSAALYKSVDFGSTWTSEIVSINDNIKWVKVTNTGEVYFQAFNYNLFNSFVYKKNYFTNVNELQFNNKSLVIYPNPTSNIINVELDGKTINKFLISIINSLGEVVLESEKSIVDLSSISSGLYSIELKTSEGEIFRTKLVKTN